MFILDDSEEPLIKDWPVVIAKPVDGGRVQKHEVTMDFVLLSQEEVDEQVEASRASGESSDVDILRRVVRKLGGFKDADGNSIEYSEALLEKVLRIPYIRIGMIQAYFQASAGQKAARKN